MNQDEVNRKRKLEQQSGAASQKDESVKKKECPFGTNCYRRNPYHFEEFKHSKLEDILNEAGSGKLSIPDSYNSQVSKETVLSQLEVLRMVLSKEKATKVEPAAHVSEPSPKRAAASSSKPHLPSTAVPRSPQKPGQSSSSSQPKKSDVMSCGAVRSFAAKLLKSAPFNYFLTTVESIPLTLEEPLSVSFKDLLDSSLGALNGSVQINYMVDLDWLLPQYEAKSLQNVPLLVIHGSELPETTVKVPANVSTIRVKPQYPFGQHHSKIMMFGYEDGSMRVVVHTANMIERDWEIHTQGAWISPSLPRLSNSSSSGDSVTGFKASFIQYLRIYPVPQLSEWIKRLQAVDFSAVNVFFIGSVPNSHKGADISKWGHIRLSKLLQSNASPLIAKWPVIGQFSSIGSMGPTPESWLEGDLGNSMAACPSMSKKCELKLIYPSYSNVEDSVHGFLGGSCLPYSRQSHKNQQWLTHFFHQWQSDCRFRTGATPHIKSYCRISPDCKQLGWFVLTSANLSKAAWGKSSGSKSLFIQSYEAGVLFIPKYVVNKDLFEIVQYSNDKDAFPLHYDVPLTKYGNNDRPWFMDDLHQIMAKSGIKTH